ncbi:MAG: hypothetical protein PHX27_04290 [Candidatus ainarchaeum sp.]|nr:hypothetical protein [Candidatus ainarchaeum sp.]
MKESSFNYSQKKIMNNFFKILMICFISTILFSGCIENNNSSNTNNINQNIIDNKTNDFNFNTQEVFNIIKTDLEYFEFTKFYPNFKPKLINYFSLTKDEFDVLKYDWLEDSQKEVYIPIIEKLVLTKNTFFVEFDDTTSINNSLIAIIDMKEKKSLKIISIMKMNMGV